MDWVILDIRCGTLSEFINKINRVPTATEKLRIGIEASKISERIVGSTPTWVLLDVERYLEHFSLAVLMDQMVWAEECLSKMRAICEKNTCSVH